MYTPKRGTFVFIGRLYAICAIRLPTMSTQTPHTNPHSLTPWRTRGASSMSPRIGIKMQKSINATNESHNTNLLERMPFYAVCFSSFECGCCRARIHKFTISPSLALLFTAQRSAYLFLLYFFLRWLLLFRGCAPIFEECLWNRLLFALASPTHMH